MKNYFLVFLLALTNHLVAQLPGFPFIDSSSEWQIKGTFVGFDFEHCNQYFSVAESEITYFIQGDTTISGKTYFKLFLKSINSYHCLNDTTIQWADSILLFDRFLREENYQLFFYSTANEADLLFRSYDDIDIGDTLNYSCVVGSIDTLFLLNQPYLKYNCDCNTEFLIQAIGSKRSLFSNLDCGIGIEGDLRNMCYRKNGFVIYVDSTANCISTGDTSVYVTAKSLPKNFGPNIFPNPTTDFLHIELPEGVNGEYMVCSIDGKVLLHKAFLDSNKLIADFSKLNKGIYFLFLLLENGEVSQYKIIKT